MKIALLGYGKMGKAIESVALSRGHEVVLRKTSADSFDGLADADVAIDFSVPSAAFENVAHSLRAGLPVISGTTGWLDKMQLIETLCQEKNGSFIYGSNFSLGVNIFFALNRQLARMMSQFPYYKVSMQEIHHTQKLDAPSGTAITLANGIIENSAYADWSLQQSGHDNTIVIDAQRIENIPGTHTVVYDSEIDAIEIKHTAHTRHGFAVGAILAAEWLQGKKGIYTMNDVLGL